MLRILFFTSILFAIFLTQGFCRNPSSSSDLAKPVLEVKAGYFFFSDALMRKIYDNGGLDVQISGSYPRWRWLQIYGSVEYQELHDRSLNGHQKTLIWIIPVSLGLKPVIKISRKIQYYFTLGPRYFFLHQHNDSSYVKRNLSRRGLGGFVNTGCNFFPRRHLLIDVFWEYSFEWTHVHSFNNNVYRRKIQVGGFSFGGGIGYSF